MIAFTDLTLRRGPRALLERVSLTVHAGWRAGVVGRNGTGKTSLFALLLGELQPDAGDVSLPSRLTIASVAQETPASDRPAVEHVLDGDAELRETERALEVAEARGDAQAIASAHERLHAIGGYAARARAARLLHGLGFAPETHERGLAHFSGGWRMRLNLAQALMTRSDLLLLDEPTNHLDLDAVFWLQDWLRSYDGTLLLISHDRDFLDAATTHTIHLADGTATLYTGNYSQFERQRAERQAQQSALRERQQRQIAHLQSYVDRFRAKASKARQAQSRLKMIERIQLAAPAHADSEFEFAFPPPARAPNPLIKLTGAALGYRDAAPVLSGVTFNLEPGDRIGLLGPNGAGKSTLVRTLAGELPPLSGEVLPAADLSVGYFAQHQLEQLDPAASPLQHLARVDAAASEQSLRDFLGGFNFRGERVFEPVAPFSGGEKARLALALVVYRRPNLLLLDEPTNHLDLDMRHALEIALQDYAGAVVLVTHDRHLVASTCDALWRVADARVAPFDGDLDDYSAWLASRHRSSAGGGVGVAPGGCRADASRTAAARAADAAGRTNATDGDSAASGKDRRRQSADERARLRRLRDDLRRVEARLERLTTKLSTVEARLADPALYESGAVNDEMYALLREQAELRGQLSDCEDAWLSAQAALESAQEQ